MDTSADGITFDENGQCNYCKDFLLKLQNDSKSHDLQRRNELDRLLDRVRKDGQGKDYDCIIGVSGGIDSSWAVMKAVEYGLRPLAVHMDNGWDSELAQSNISNLITTLNVDLFTLVIDWDEYRSLMNAFFAANVIDVELLYDNAMLAVNYDQARLNDLHFILSGTNTSTEGMRIPANWNWNKRDWRNIKGIARAFGNVPIETFPHLSNRQFVLDRYIRRIHWIPFLDFLGYDRPAAIGELENKVGFRAYPYKHYESVFTRFYQGHILPTKFGVDKRRVHFSTLIISGSMSRTEALTDLESIAYPDQNSLDGDIEYFLKKMNWSESDLEIYLTSKPIAHSRYPNDATFVKYGLKLKRAAKRFF
jgi:N-acetyl sugar amidotransferase